MGWPFVRTALVGVLSLAGASFASGGGRRRVRTPLCPLPWSRRHGSRPARGSHEASAGGPYAAGRSRQRRVPFKPCCRRHPQRRRGARSRILRDARVGQLLWREGQPPGRQRADCRSGRLHKKPAAEITPPSQQTRISLPPQWSEVCHEADDHLDLDRRRRTRPPFCKPWTRKRVWSFSMTSSMPIIGQPTTSSMLGSAAHMNWWGLCRHAVARAPRVEGRHRCRRTSRRTEIVRPINLRLVPTAPTAIRKLLRLV